MITPIFNYYWAQYFRTERTAQCMSHLSPPAWAPCFWRRAASKSSGHELQSPASRPVQEGTKEGRRKRCQRMTRRRSRAALSLGGRALLDAAIDCRRGAAADEFSRLEPSFLRIGGARNHPRRGERSHRRIAPNPRSMRKEGTLCGVWAQPTTLKRQTGG